MNNIYLACYHGRADKWLHRLLDNATKFFTRGKYSHCELAIHLGNGKYECYSSSYRDGGVRVKVMTLDPKKWDLIAVDNISESELRRYFTATKGSDYDLLGALGVVLGLREHPDKYFCSEWCFNAITGGQDGWRFSPVELFCLACVVELGLWRMQ